MVILYNIFIFLSLIIFFPFIAVKFIINKRFRYHFLDRIFPKPLRENNYFLLHASSFGEVKTILSFLDIFEKKLNKKAVISVFTDTGHKQIKNREGFLMPIDIIPLYKRIFRNPPETAIFFETEIWPSYIHTLKSKGSKVVLINARMSEKSFRRYKRFSLLFKKTLSNFDLIIAKSKMDAKRYKYFSDRVIVCGNIKSCVLSLKKRKKATREDFLIVSKKDIMVLASFHKEEIEVALEIVSRFKDRFFIVIAPRHMEDVEIFEGELKKNGIDFVRRTEGKVSKSLLLLDTLGELTQIYSISSITIIGGSFNARLKGHNPLEPIFYKNILICGPFVESFKEEVEKLKKLSFIHQIKGENFKQEIEDVLKNASKPEVDQFFRELSYILNCYLFNTFNAK